ncbi:MAG: hypothetical protein ACXABK_02810, partial [Candidatus Heimdallarchaeaceae archaeon]
FIDPSPNLTIESSPCPILDHCKIYDKVKNDSISKSTDSILNELDSSFSSLDIFKPSVSDSNRTYVDRITVNDDDINMMNLFNEPSFDDIVDSLPSDDDSFGDSYDSKNSKNMIGLSSLTRYGSKSQIKTSQIPSNLRSRCLNCSSIISIKWKYCAVCGHSNG